MSVPGNAAVIQSAGGGPGVGNYVSDNLIITSYSENGQLRTSFMYRLAAPSSFGNSFGYEESLSGFFFIDVAQSYDLTQDEHEIRMGFSAINEQNVAEGIFVGSAYDQAEIPDYINWYVATEGLLNTSALNYRPENGGADPANSLWFEEGTAYGYHSDWSPFLCIECGLDLALNLLHMDFTGGNLSVDLSDERLAIILGLDTYSGNTPYGFDLNLTRAPVPVPAAWLLFASAMVVFARRANKTWHTV